MTLKLKTLLTVCLLAVCQLGAAAPAKHQDTVKLVSIFPRTGVYAQALNMGSVADSIQLAIDEINASGGLLGHKVELVEMDSKSSPQSARDAASAAAALKPLAVIGDQVSNLSLAMAPVLQQRKILMISPLSTHADLTMVGDYIFRMCYLDSDQGKAMAEFARKRLRANSVVTLTNASAKYSQDLTLHFSQRLHQLGGTVLAELTYSDDQTDYRVMLEAAKRHHPDVIFIPGYTKDAGTLIKQARDMGIRAHFVGGDGWGSRLSVYAGAASDGSYSAAHWHAGDPRAISREFAQRASRFPGATKVSTYVLAYDSVQVLAAAVRRANSLDPARVRDELAATRNLPLVSGTITFDKNRNPIKPVVVVRHQGGDLHFVEAITP